METKGTDPLAVAARLRIIMADLEIGTAVGLARFLGAQVSQVGNWMAGYNLPPVKWMDVLCRKRPGLTLDWVYRGIADGMPSALVIKLIALEEGMDVPLGLKPPRQSVAPRPARATGTRSNLKRKRRSRAT